MTCTTESEVWGEKIGSLFVVSLNYEYGGIYEHEVDLMIDMSFCIVGEMILLLMDHDVSQLL